MGRKGLTTLAPPNGVIICWQFDEPSLDILKNWFKACSADAHTWGGELATVHRKNIKIPIAHSCNGKLNEFQPLGKMDLTIKLENPRLQVLGEAWAVLELIFKSDVITERAAQLNQLGFKMHKNYLPRIPIAFRAKSSSSQWLKLLPTRELRVVEETIGPFSRNFPKFAHLDPDEVE
jgi:hypothetical protein